MKSQVDVPPCPTVTDGEVPDENWQSRYNEVMQDAFLQKKYCRSRRLLDKWNYIHQFLPELVCPNPNGVVVDIGPGPGEFLELCRELGYGIQGVDAATDFGGMGAPYLTLSRLMTSRNKIPVEYSGLKNWLDYHNPRIEPGSVALINSQGSIEQSCSHLMDGPSHELHHDCRQLKWQKGPELASFFLNMMKCFNRWLRPGGMVFIYANGAANTRIYRRVIEKSARQIESLKLVYREDRIHKWVKKEND